MPFKPGQSGNPHGRPRIGLSLADAVRAGGSAEALAAQAWAMLADPKLKATERVAVLEFLADRGWGRATQSIDLAVEAHAAPAVDHAAMLSRLTVEERIQLLELRRKATGASEESLTLTAPDGDALEVTAKLAGGES
jgi:hypothetical protein